MVARVSVIDDPYLVLNVPHTKATDDEIKESYRVLAMKYHPDKWASKYFTQSEKDHATTVFKKINSAKELLLDETQRSKFDREFIRLGRCKDNGDNGDNGANKNDNNCRENDRRGTTPAPSSSSNTNNNNSNSRPHNHQQSQSQSQPRRGTTPSSSSASSNTNNNNSNSRTRNHQQYQSQSQSQPSPPPLPKGWTTHKDDMSRKLCYYHKESGHMSWNHPALCSNTSEYIKCARKMYTKYEYNIVVSILLPYPGPLGVYVKKERNGSAIVTKVIPNSQAKLAGLQCGDVLCLSGSNGQNKIGYDIFTLDAKSTKRPIHLEVNRCLLSEEGYEIVSTPAAAARARTGDAKVDAEADAVADAEARRKARHQPFFMKNRH